MRKVIGIGETVLDIIFKNEGQQTGATAGTDGQSTGFQPVKAVPGGSAFNAIISLGRAGVPAAFISETGNDRVGENVKHYLTDNNVDASGVCVFPDSKSPLSLAFLDEQNNAEYVFYKDHPHDRLEFTYPDVQHDDIVLFGSFFAINPVVRPQVKSFFDYARNRGAILYYDVNYRSSHRHEVVKMMPNILENFELADIVRGSDEDFSIMFNKHDADSVYRAEISFYTKNFIYTRGSNPVEVRATGGFSKQYPVTDIDVVSTIGAGDNFNAGFIYGLLHYGITREQITAGLSEQQWDSLITLAQQFSANCCQSLNNSISKEFAESLKA